MTTSAADRLRSAIYHALAMGIPRRDIFTMVATAPPPSPSILADDDEAWPNSPDAIVYDEVPAGLLTLADAATKYGVRHNTLEVALFRGNIPRAGRLRGSGYGGLRNLVSEAALRRYLNLPPEEGVAPDAGPEPLPRRLVAGEKLPIYDALPEGLITLQEAARRYGVPARRISNWVQRGRLTRMGYLRGRSPQGGYVALVEAELAALVRSNSQVVG